MLWPLCIYKRHKSHLHRPFAGLLAHVNPEQIRPSVFNIELTHHSPGSWRVPHFFQKIFQRNGFDIGADVASLAHFCQKMKAPDFVPSMQTTWLLFDHIISLLLSPVCSGAFWELNCDQLKVTNSWCRCFPWLCVRTFHWTGITWMKYKTHFIFINYLYAVRFWNASSSNVNNPHALLL